MKKHKNRILRAVRAAVFLFVLALMILGLDKSLKLIQEDNLCPRYYEYPKDTFDVAFLGASLVMYGIYPVEMYDEYGIASYSLTTGNQSIEASYYLAKEVIEKDHPSLIVLDCSFASSDEKKMEPQYIHYITDTMPYLNKNRLDIIRNLAITDDYKPLLFPLIAFHSRWQELTYGDFLPQTKEMVYGAKITGRVNVTAPYDEAKITPGALSEQSRSSIEKIIRLCRENDTGLMLLTMPVPGKNKFFDQDGYNLRVSAAAEVDELAKKNGILHANYVGDKKNLEDLGLDLQMDAYDGEHLNRWGAAKFTRTLGKYIKAHFDIPDRRGQGGAYSLIDKDLFPY